MRFSFVTLSIRRFASYEHRPIRNPVERFAADWRRPVRGSQHEMLLRRHGTEIADNALCAFPLLDYPDVSANTAVMAGRDPAIQKNTRYFKSFGWPGQPGEVMARP